MNKVKLLSIISIGLLISNLALVGFIVFGKHRPGPHEGPRNLIIESLHFDAKQVEVYDQLIQEHRQEIRQSDEKLRGLKNELYKGLASNASAATNDSLINEIGKVQNHIETTHLSHFEAIKKLCKPNQMEDFNALTGELAKLFAPHPHPKRP